MVNKAKLNREFFEAMLKEAVTEDFERDLRSLPSEQELQETCGISSDTKRKIERMIRAERRRSVYQKMRAVSKRVAILLAIVVPVSFGSLLSVEASRNAIFNAIIEWQSDRTKISYQQNASGSADKAAEDQSDAKYLPSYIPAGFTVNKKSALGDIFITVYQNNEGQTITLSQSSLSESQSGIVDSEHTTFSQITVNGKEASLFQGNQSEYSSFVIWQNDKCSFILESKIDAKELIKIADSIKAQ